MKSTATEMDKFAKLSSDMRTAAFELEKSASDMRTEIGRQSEASCAPVPVTGHTACGLLIWGGALAGDTSPLVCVCGGGRCSGDGLPSLSQGRSRLSPS
jgi:hypothetical protein